MDTKDQVKLVQNYVGLMGKMYVILLRILDDYFGAPLSTNEKVVLLVLDEDPISITEISQRTGLLLTTLTNVIDKMEEKQLVRRRQSRTDRRVVKIELAVAGRHVRSSFDILLGQLSSAFLDFLPEKHRNDFTALLHETLQVIITEADTVQEAMGSLIEPLKQTLANQFKRD